MKTVSVALVVCLNVGVDPPGKVDVRNQQIGVGDATFFLTDTHQKSIQTKTLIHFKI